MTMDNKAINQIKNLNAAAAPCQKTGLSQLPRWHMMAFDKRNETTNKSHAGLTETVLCIKLTLCRWFGFFSCDCVVVSQMNLFTTIDNSVKLWFSMGLWNARISSSMCFFLSFASTLAGMLEDILRKCEGGEQSAQ